MSFPEAPDETDIKRLFAQQAATDQRIDVLIDAVNGLGVNLQWLIDNAKGIFQMFSNPQFIAQMSGGLGGMFGGAPSDGGPEGE